MLAALPKTIWLRFIEIWAKQAKTSSTTYMKVHSVQQQTMNPHEAYSQFRRNMY